MGTETKIAWCDHTFNPWRGCAKVSPGCDHCYAEKTAKRNPVVFGEWGPEGIRSLAAKSYLRLPERWNRQAARDGVRRRVFCGSMMDVFEDREGLRTSRERLFELIYQCQNLDWLLLTKRPDNVARFILGYRGIDGRAWVDAFPNVWLGVSVENQQAADERIPILLQTPAAVRFLSCEPLLGPLDLRKAGKTLRGDDFDSLYGWHTTFQYKARNEGEASIGVRSSSHFIDGRKVPRLDWVIAGGESGPWARPCNLEWVRSIVAQCKAAGVPAFVKQLGACAIDERNGVAGPSLVVPDEAASLVSRRLTHPKGGDPAEWPEDLRVQEFPAPRALD